MRRTSHAGQPFLFVRFRFCGGPFTWADVFLHGHLLMVSTLSTKQPCREGPCWLVINLGFCQGAKGMQELTAPNVCAPHNSSNVRKGSHCGSKRAGIWNLCLWHGMLHGYKPSTHATCNVPGVRAFSPAPAQPPHHCHVIVDASINYNDVKLARSLHPLPAPPARSSPSTSIHHINLEFSHSQRF